MLIWMVSVLMYGGKNLKIEMKYLKRFNESKTQITKKMIRELFSVDDVKINPDGTVDVLDEGDVMVSSFVLYQKNMDSTKLPIKFRNVRGGITYNGASLSGTKKLTTLEGCPKTCAYFHFNGLDATDLEGGPEYVYDRFSVFKSPNLKSLRGGPISVGGSYECYNTGVTSLEGIPQIINGDLDCNSTKITNFRGGPEIVRKSLFAKNCNLTSLEGLPKEIGETLLFTGEEIWDPSPLRNVIIGQSLQCSGKISKLINFFFELHGNYNSAGFVFLTTILPYQRFIESLDYNWVKGDAEEPKIDLFRLREAMEEFDLHLDYFVEKHSEWLNSIGPYQFIDLEGVRVNILGDKI